MVIKPSGIDYAALRPFDMALMDMAGRSDGVVHLALGGCMKNLLALKPKCLRA